MSDYFELIITVRRPTYLPLNCYILMREPIVRQQLPSIAICRYASSQLMFVWGQGSQEKFGELLTFVIQVWPLVCHELETELTKSWEWRCLSLCGQVRKWPREASVHGSCVHVSSWQTKSVESISNTQSKRTSDLFM